MNRRNFLRYVAYAAPLAIAAPAVARTIFLPPPKRLIKCDEYFASVNSWYLKTTYDENAGLKRVLRTNEGIFDLAPIKAEGSIIAYDREIAPWRLDPQRDVYNAVVEGQRYTVTSEEVEDLTTDAEYADMGRRLHEAYLESQRHTKLNIMARILNQGVK